MYLKIVESYNGSDHRFKPAHKAMSIKYALTTVALCKQGGTLSHLPLLGVLHELHHDVLEVLEVLPFSRYIPCRAVDLLFELSNFGELDSLQRRKKIGEI